jgi:stage II sporulation SpoAA-like protein
MPALPNPARTPWAETDPAERLWLRSRSRIVVAFVPALGFPKPPVQAQAYRVEVLAHRIVCIAAEGDLEAEEARGLLEEVQRATTEVGEPVRLLVDARRSGRHTAEARRVLYKSFTDVPPGCMAVVGAPLRKRLLIRIMMWNSLVTPVRFFDAPERALAWLAEQR